MRSVQTIFLELSGVVCPDVLLEASSYQGDVMISAQSAIGRPTSEAWRNSLHKLAKWRNSLHGAFLPTMISS